MSPEAVAVVMKHYDAAAELDPARYAGHSLRAGLVTQAAMNGVPELAFMKQPLPQIERHAPEIHPRRQPTNI